MDRLDFLAELRSFRQTNASVSAQEDEQAGDVKYTGRREGVSNLEQYLRSAKMAL
jgi:hypothetical protein